MNESHLSFDYSPLDSERFARRIYRANLASVDAFHLKEAMRQQRVDTLIMRLPIDQASTLACLHDVGLTPIFGDVQVHYDVALSEFTATDDRPGFELMPIEAADALKLHNLAKEVFNDYSSHYSANPLLPRSSISDGYADWAVRHIGIAETPVWFVYDNGDLVGFTACKVDAASGSVRGVLNGILPAARGRGCYSAMLHKMLKLFSKAGMRTFMITTQVHNIAVQRAWASAGLKLRGVDCTVHINFEWNNDEHIDSIQY